MTETILELDERRRTSLGKIGRHRRYLATVEEDGTIVLAPAVVMSEAEAKLLQRPDILDRIEANRANGLKGRTDRPE
jgi:hypothetical protein